MVDGIETRSLGYGHFILFNRSGGCHLQWLYVRKRLHGYWRDLFFMPTLAELVSFCQRFSYALTLDAARQVNTRAIALRVQFQK